MKKHTSIRIEEEYLRIIKKNFGSVQKAIDIWVAHYLELLNAKAADVKSISSEKKEELK